jgi:hypothetical protein
LLQDKFIVLKIFDLTSDLNNLNSETQEPTLTNKKKTTSTSKVLDKQNLRAHAKFQNLTITPTGRKILCPRNKKNNARNSGQNVLPATLRGGTHTSLGKKHR